MQEPKDKVGFVISKGEGAVAGTVDDPVVVSLADEASSNLPDPLERGIWYTPGPLVVKEKFSRNALCSCGSKRKFKKCCGK